MGFFQMLSVNRDLNQVVVTIHSKIHKLEDLINGHRGVDSANYYQVRSTISDIENEVRYMENKVDSLGYAERVSLLLMWTNGRKYPWDQWLCFLRFSMEEAKSFVQSYEASHSR